MNLRLKMALLFSGLVAFVLVLSSLLIYLFYADFRDDEFYLRLEQKAVTTYRLLVDVKEIDNNLLQLIDSATLRELYNEEILIFDTSLSLVYSNTDVRTSNYPEELLRRTIKRKRIELKEEEKEVLGLYLDNKESPMIVMASAYDRYGMRKMENLKWILIVVSMAGLIITGFFSYFYVQQVFGPLQQLHHQIKRISETNLSERLKVKKQEDEIAALGKDFNQMLARLEEAFRVQKSFIQHASHELRTPLANLVLQTETALNRPHTSEEYKTLLMSLNEDHRNLSSLVNALLMLSKYESMENMDLQKHRIDEILDKAIEEVTAFHPDYQVSLDYRKIPEQESQLEVYCNELLVRIAFGNLIRNGCKYSDSKQVHVFIDYDEKSVSVNFTNNGPVLRKEERFHLYMPFFRGENAAQKKGFGLGLSIVKRILQLHRANIQYDVTPEGFNRFEVLFTR